MRVVVGFELLGTTTVFKLEDAPNDIAGLGENRTADTSPLAGGDLVARGTALYDRLTAHPSVSACLDQLLTMPPGADPLPLYFHVMAEPADELPWEQLYSPTQGFCALDPRWPVGRIARRRRRLEERTFTEPFRIVAVLSAARRSGLRQLEALLAATAGADGTAVRARLHVISGEDAVLDAVAASGRADVTAEAIAGTAPEVNRQIARARPHVLHLLCHGGAVAGVRTLALATRADFDADEETGDVRIKASDLVTVLGPCNPWLVVLAACETADAGTAPALAHDVVADGIPAVIGMRRMVDLTAADGFCRTLYPEVLATVRRAVDPDRPERARTVDWASVLTAPRTALGGSNPVSRDAWSDPVLYVQDTPLLVVRASPSMEPEAYVNLRARLDVWEGYLANLDPDETPPALLEELRAEIRRLRELLGMDDP